MKNKLCLITGASSGIGKALAFELIKLQAKLILLCKDEEGRKTINIMLGENNNENKADIYVVDLSLQKNILDFYHQFALKYKKLDVLINNAGINIPQRILTEEGIEYMFAVNHLAPFLLTQLLLNFLKLGTNSQIINIGSNGERYAAFNFENLQGEIRFHGMKQYCQTKMCNLFFTYQLHNNIKNNLITVNCIHPGGVRTNIMNHYKFTIYKLIWYLLYPFLKSPKKVANRIASLIKKNFFYSNSGKYFFFDNELTSSPITYNEEYLKKLWEISEELTNVHILKGCQK